MRGCSFGRLRRQRPAQRRLCPVEVLDVARRIDERVGAAGLQGLDLARQVEIPSVRSQEDVAGQGA
jgi:hypothetical protein